MEQLQKGEKGVMRAMRVEESPGHLTRSRPRHLAQALRITAGAFARPLAIFRCYLSYMQPGLRRLRRSECGDLSDVFAVFLLVILFAAVAIGGFLIWLYTEPTWWESFLGRTRWDKLMDLFGR